MSEERRVSMEWVNSLSLEQLREELADYVHRHYSLLDALRQAPEMPSVGVLLDLDQASHWPEDNVRGKKLQRELGSFVIPYKSECESGAGVWARIRAGLVSSVTTPEPPHGR